MTSQPSIRELIAGCHYSCCGGDYCETTQEDCENDLNKTLSEIRKRIEGLKIGDDNIKEYLVFNRGIDEVLGLFD
jgi:hypothetical protein